MRNVTPHATPHPTPLDDTPADLATALRTGPFHVALRAAIAADARAAFACVCSRGALTSAVKTVMKALVAPQEPSNDGWFRPLTVTAPPGTRSTLDLRNTAAIGVEDSSAPFSISWNAGTATAGGDLLPAAVGFVAGVVVRIARDHQHGCAVLGRRRGRTAYDARVGGTRAHVKRHAGRRDRQ